MPSSKHIPDNSAILLFKFKNIDDRDRFFNLSDFEFILGKSLALALKNDAEFKAYKYP